MAASTKTGILITELRLVKRPRQLVNFNFTSFPSAPIAVPLEPVKLNSISRDESFETDFLGSQPSDWSRKSTPSNVSVQFDDLLQTHCLHVNPAPSQKGQAPPANLPSTTNNNAAVQQSATLSQEAVSPQKPAQVPLDIASIAINFILALEHPCRTHFHATEIDSDITGDHSGHELMASIFLYSKAPKQVFDNLDVASWTARSVGLNNLWQMSQSLPKGDFEITPVQAWLMMTQRLGFPRVLEKVNELKAELGKLVGCFAFGAVMDEARFWAAIQNVTGE